MVTVTVIKLSGKRRKPYAARITTSWTQDGKQEKKYLGYFKTRQEVMKALADYNENPFDLASREITFADLFERWRKVKYKEKEMPAEYVSAYKKLCSNSRLTKKLSQQILRHWSNFPRKNKAKFINLSRPKN